MTTAAKRVRLPAPRISDGRDAAVVSIRLTTKRQATFPKELCEALGLEAGDRILLEPKIVDGEAVWVLRKKKIDWSFIGSAKPRKKVSHSLAAIRKSIERGWAGERRK